MNYPLPAIGVLALGASLLGHPARTEEVPPQPVEGAIDWIFGYEAGKKLAQQNGKPMFVVFRCER